MLPMQGAPSYDDLELDREVPLEKNGPDPEKEDRVMLTRHRVSRILFDDKFYDYPVSLKLETLKNMGIFTTMKVGFSYLASLLHKRPDDNLENFYINRFGKKLYSMFFEYYTCTDGVFYIGYIIIRYFDISIYKIGRFYDKFTITCFFDLN